jgi:predicted metal-binding protein
METADKNLKAHLFVCTSCTYKKADQTDSLPETAAQLRKNIKNKAIELHGRGVVRVSSVECLGECEHGIATVLYPRGEWNLCVRPEDEEKLLTKIDELVNN